LACDAVSTLRFLREAADYKASARKKGRPKAPFPVLR